MTKRKAPNPTGKGGFADHPEHMSGGRWRSDDSIPFWMHKFEYMALEEFKEWMDNHPTEITPAKVTAWNMVNRMMGEDDKVAIDSTNLVLDRTDGRPTQIVQTQEIPAPRPLLEIQHADSTNHDDETSGTVA